jgi:metal-dependent amidase/aminoacylase/carboxypeptidase family protein
MEEDGFVMVSNPGSAPFSDTLENSTQYHHDSKNDDGFLSETDRIVEGLRDQLWPLNEFIHENPELAFQERKAHKVLTDFMRSRKEGWQVIPSACGIETAWKAVYDSGKRGPVVSFNVEMGMLAKQTQ